MQGIWFFGATEATTRCPLLRGTEYRSAQTTSGPIFSAHRNSLAEISNISSELDRKDATSRLVPGLADSSMISFESVNSPDHFLRHQDFEVNFNKLRHEPACLRAFPQTVKRSLLMSRRIQDRTLTQI
jgi:hypothetical protein